MLNQKGKNHSNGRTTLLIHMHPHSYFWFLTQRGAWDTWHLWCGGSNLELDRSCFAFAALLAGAYVKEMEAAQDDFVQSWETKSTPLGWHKGHKLGTGSWVPPCGWHANTDGGTRQWGRGKEEKCATCFLLLSLHFLCSTHRPSLCSQMNHVSLLSFFSLHLLFPVLKILSSTSFALLTLQRPPLTLLQGSILSLLYARSFNRFCTVSYHRFLELPL